MKGRSLETNWLKRFDRSLTQPEVVFVADLNIDGVKVGGYYIEPQSREVAVGEFLVDAQFGVIAVSSNKEDDFIASTIAHEWRHHWQRHNGIKFDHIKWTGDKSIPWEDSIRKYFLSSRSEMDALLFEGRTSKSVDTDMMRDAVFSGTTLTPAIMRGVVRIGL